MTEDVTRYGSGAPGDEPPRSDAGAPGASDSADDLAALERLKALGGGPAHAKHQPASAEQLPEARARGAHAAPRRRPSASYGSGRTVARLAVPVVFLVAVIVVVVLMLQSGVLGGGGTAETAVSPSPSVSASGRRLDEGAQRHQGLRRQVRGYALGHRGQVQDDRGRPRGSQSQDQHDHARGRHQNQGPEQLALALRATLVVRPPRSIWYICLVRRGLPPQRPSWVAVPAVERSPTSSVQASSRCQVLPA